MTRLIDADALYIELVKMKDFGELTAKKAIRVVKNATTIDAVRHGKWVFNPSDAFEAMFAKPKCSECGFESADGWKYCPNCGARMDEE